MPSSNGVYSLPSGYLAVTGATIQASQHNPPLEDIAAALTARLSRDGTAAMTGAIQLLPGTAALPGAAFSTDLTSGLYKTTNGIGVTVAGAQVAEFTSAGMASGVRMLGEIVGWTRGGSAPALWVFPVGQTLSRTTYAALWAQAQIEIAAGSTFFNNGDGSTTFGIGDCRGRTLVAADNMGGSAANRVNSVLANPIGSTGGNQTPLLVLANLPNYSPPFTANPTGQTFLTSLTTSLTAAGSGAGYNYVSGGNSLVVPLVTGSVGSINSGQAQTGFSVLQPSIVCYYIMFAGA